METSSSEIFSRLHNKIHRATQLLNRKNTIDIFQTTTSDRLSQDTQTAITAYFNDSDNPIVSLDRVPGVSPTDAKKLKKIDRADETSSRLTAQMVKTDIEINQIADEVVDHSATEINTRFNLNYFLTHREDKNIDPKNPDSSLYELVIAQRRRLSKEGQDWKEKISKSRSVRSALKEAGCLSPEKADVLPLEEFQQLSTLVIETRESFRKKLELLREWRNYFPNPEIFSQLGAFEDLLDTRIITGITAQGKQDILQKITEMESEFNFISSFQSGNEVPDIFTPDNSDTSYIDIAHKTLSKIPEGVRNHIKKITFETTPEEQQRVIQTRDSNGEIDIQRQTLIEYGLATFEIDKQGHLKHADIIARGTSPKSLDQSLMHEFGHVYVGLLTYEELVELQSILNSSKVLTVHATTATAPDAYRRPEEEQAAEIFRMGIKDPVALGCASLLQFDFFTKVHLKYCNPAEYERFSQILQTARNEVSKLDDFEKKKRWVDFLRED